MELFSANVFVTPSTHTYPVLLSCTDCKSAYKCTYIHIPGGSVAYCGGSVGHDPCATCGAYLCAPLGVPTPHTSLAPIQPAVTLNLAHSSSYSVCSPRGRRARPRASA